LSVGDAYLDAEDYKEQKLIEHRDGIAIDRLTGGVSGNAKFDLETVTEGTTFTTTLRLRNFEIWQLGMLFVIVKDLEDELITLGSGRSRGLGRVRGGIRMKQDGAYPGGLVLCIPRAVGDPKEKAGELWGLGRWLKEEKEAEVYGCDPDDMLTLSSEVAHKHGGVRNTRVFTGDTLDDLRNRSIEAFVERMQQWELARIAPAGEGSR
jgi:hypothetical protein